MESHLSLKILRNNRFLFGEDVFISYARMDASAYALALANELEKVGLSCYLDQWDTEPGPQLPPRILRALKRSTVMVIISSAAAVSSRSIEIEISAFRKTSRPIVPVNIDNHLRDATWGSYVAGAAMSNDALVNLIAGKPSPNVISRINNATRFTRQKTRLKTIFWAAILILATLTVATFWNLNEKNVQTKILEQSLVQLEVQTKLAESRLGEIDNQALIAERSRKTADSSAAVANVRLKEIEKQTAIAQARYMAAKALESIPNEPEKALRFAVMALDHADVLESRSALQRALLHYSRIVAVRKLHKAEVSAVAFSLDGSLLASADEMSGKNLIITNVNGFTSKTIIDDEAGKTGIRLAGGGYAALMFAPHSNRFLLASGRVVNDIIDSKGITKQQVDTRAINPAASQIVTLSDQALCLRDDRRSALICTQLFDLVGEDAKDVFFSADGQMLIVQTESHVLVWDVDQFRIWDFDDDEEPPDRTPRIFSNGKYIERLNLELRGERLAILQGNSVVVWDAKTGDTLGGIKTGINSLVRDAVVWPGRDYVVTAGGGGGTGAPALTAWNIKSGERIGAFLESHDRAILSLAFNPDGSLLAAGDSRGNIILWNMAKESVLGTSLVSDTVSLSAVDILPNTKTVVLGHKDGTVCTYDLESGQIETFSQSLNTPIQELVTDSRHDKLYGFTANGLVAQYDLRKKQLIRTAQLRLDSMPIAIRLNATGTDLTVIEKDYQAMSYNTKTLMPKGESVALLTESFVSDLAIHPRFPVALLCGGFALRVCDLRSGRLSSHGLLGSTTGIEISADGKQVAIIEDMNVRIYKSNLVESISNSKGYLQLPSVALSGHTEPIIAAAFSPDGKTVATTALRYETANKDVLKEIIQPGDRYELRVWDTRTGGQIGEPLLCNSLITDIKYSDDGKKIITLSGDGSARVWDIDPFVWRLRALNIVGELERK